jgi:hypothetical protein
MAAKVQLQNFRFSIYIDTDGTVTLTDLPPELRDVAEALDPSRTWGRVCPMAPSRPGTPTTENRSARETASQDLAGGNGRA